jgi:chromosome segregation ATPase
MATLDTLDAERRTYAEEISDERRQRVALRAQLRAARAERAAMEEERDSLREAVLHLIEKGTSYVVRKKNTLLTHTRLIVEVCNDYSLWPHSGLASTSLASPFFFSLSSRLGAHLR